ncbi:Protein kinase-like domain containing protein [Klebsormidium nitens]|uniref:Protein kinase-like domain containing protein n=1 Tax=Klebsormidium nitens TaxID=105231 RepID=A0A1Y1I1Q0_KLENI|nr:Protein kinase-like domain containing protein [Klebsormidium nitens]|eukprot:GAQ82686.1 Protein kinase-like domain containing protein [Klebsormidium nitens]
MEIDHGGGTEYAERLHPAERSHGLEQGGLREDVWLTEFVTDGFAGAVFRGLFGGKAVAVKTLDMSRSTSRLGYLLNEATVLMELSPLWDVTVPRLLAYGPYTDSTYAVILSWIEGRPLMVHDKGLLRSAAEALRSVHRRGYLHGDVRLSNFIVDGQNKVSCIDFGFAQKSLDDQAFRKEERQLKACFGKE